VERGDAPRGSRGLWNRGSRPRRTECDVSEKDDEAKALGRAAATCVRKPGHSADPSALPPSRHGRRPAPDRAAPPGLQGEPTAAAAAPSAADIGHQRRVRRRPPCWGRPLRGAEVPRTANKDQIKAGTCRGQAFPPRPHPPALAHLAGQSRRSSTHPRRHEALEDATPRQVYLSTLGESPSRAGAGRQRRPERDVQVFEKQQSAPAQREDALAAAVRPGLRRSTAPRTWRRRPGPFK
jgi:hypothetical protein